MKTVEAVLHYAERWAIAISQFKGRNTRRVEELRSNMQDLIRLSNEVEHVTTEFAVDRMPKEEHKIEAFVDRYSDWFDADDSYDQIRDRATQILAFAEVHSDYRTIKRKADGLVRKQKAS